MSIAKLGEKGKSIVEKNALYASILVVIVGLASFGLGRLSEPQKSVPVVAIEDAFPEPGMVLGAGENEVIMPASEGSGQFVVSRSGTKYHYLWCPGASQIKESNKLWFATREDAEAAGYEPAKNCEGL